MGVQLCVRCFCASLQIPQMSCWFLLPEELLLLTVHIAHPWRDSSLLSQVREVSQCQAEPLEICVCSVSTAPGDNGLQKLWPHSKTTGSLHSSQHTGSRVILLRPRCVRSHSGYLFSLSLSVVLLFINLLSLSQIVLWSFLGSTLFQHSQIVS